MEKGNGERRAHRSERGFGRPKESVVIRISRKGDQGGNCVREMDARLGCSREGGRSPGGVWSGIVGKKVCDGSEGRDTAQKKGAK